MSSVDISCIDACLGIEEKISTLDGEKICNIPAGIQHGTRIKLSGLGFPLCPNSSNRGDLLIEVNVKTLKSLTEAQKKTLLLVKQLGV